MRSLKLVDWLKNRLEQAEGVIKKHAKRMVEENFAIEALNSDALFTAATEQRLLKVLLGNLEIDPECLEPQGSFADREDYCRDYLMRKICYPFPGSTCPVNNLTTVYQANIASKMLREYFKGKVEVPF